MYVILGIGSFGYYVAKKLYESGLEVLAIDRNREKVINAEKICTKAIVADVTDKETLKKLDVADSKAVVIALGDDMAASILATLHLKELGSKYVVVKALSEEHARILTKVGANEVVFPERDTALKVADQLISPNKLDSLYLSEDYSIWEIVPDNAWIGKTIEQSRIRSRHRVEIIAVRDTLANTLYMMPQPDYVIKDSDMLVVLGNNKDLEKLKNFSD